MIKRDRVKFSKFAKQKAEEYQDSSDKSELNNLIQSEYEAKQLLINIKTANDQTHQMSEVRNRMDDNAKKLAAVIDSTKNQTAMTVNAGRDVNFLTNRQMYKRFILLGLVILVFILDFALLIRRITRFF